MNSNLKNKIKILEETRTIGVTTGSVSGLYLFKDSEVVAFESTLERDFLMRLETFNHVTNVTSQPLTLEYTCSQNKTRHYTPDFLVEFDLRIWPYKPPQLIEVKPRKFIKEQLITHRDKFKAAFQLCKESAYVFHFMDEAKIHDQRFLNAKFLKRFKHNEVDPTERKCVLELFKTSPFLSFEQILKNNYIGKRYRAEGIQIVWALISQGTLNCDLNQKLSFQTELWVPGDE